MAQSAGTQIYLARQPILDRELGLYGYELLYRSGPEGGFDGTEAVLATMNVLGNSLLGFGLENLLKGRLGFVNFPRELLLTDITALLPPDSIVIELLETVEPDDLVVQGCRKLRNAGYKLALDDVVAGAPILGLASLASIIKVDFRATTAAERKALLSAYGRQDVLLLAEKVETQEEYAQAEREGFHLFQGYFFMRPVILSQSEIPALKLNYLRLMKEIHGPDLQFWQIERLIKQEASLCRRLLRYVNSAAFARRNHVSSIREAMVMLGEDELKRWATLAALPALASDKPDELLQSAVLRARFCELIAPWAGLAARRQELFLMGMFSLLDAMVGRPLEELLNELHIPADICQALLGTAGDGNKPAQVYKLVLASEQADWDAAARIAAQFGLSAESKQVSDLFTEAIHWCGDMHRPTR